MTVLLVEDDTTIRDLVAERLERSGLTVTACASAAAARDALRRQSFHAVILDITLPDGSGLDLLVELRSSGSAAHVIMLSGAASEVDRVRALELGADDYVVKPFYARELTARILAARRRRDPKADSTLRVGPLEIDVAAREVLSSGEPLELTTKEFDLLAFLAARPGHVFSRDELLRAVWHSATDWQQAATVTEHMRRLRAKVELDPAQPQLLRTVRGAGYRFDLPTVDREGVASDPEPAIASVMVVQADGRIVAVDPGTLALLGCQDENEIVGRHYMDFVAPSSVEAVAERARLTGRGDPVRSQLFCLRRIDGSEVAVELSSSAMEWNGGPARAITLTLVADASVRFRQAVTGIMTEVSDAVVITDLHFHIRSWNRAAERLYGWSEPEVLGRHISDVVRWLGDDIDLVAAWRALETTGRWHGEARQLTREGTEVCVQGSTTVSRDDEGEAVAVVSINRRVLPALETHDGPSAADVADLRRGLDVGEFELYYQPLVALDGNRIVALEALLRWNHPDRGLLGPAAFIDTAERSGLILQLGAFALDSACRQGATWRQRGLELDVGVNLSTTELGDPVYVQRFLAILESSEMDPAHLWVEVTETALVKDVEQAGIHLRRMAALGVSISIDDFGTGWASLTYLKEFPIHALKVDRSFVADVDHNVNDAAIVRSILSLGAELGLPVVAEGVETMAQEKALVALGCSMGQGFLYGAPTRAADVPLHRVRAAGAGMPVPLPAAPPSIGLTPAGPARAEAMAAAALESTASDPVARTLRELLRIRSAQGAADLVRGFAEQMGATLVPAAEAGPGALPLDLSLGEGPPVLAEVDPLSPDRLQLERALPRLVEDARQAIDLLRQTDGFEVHTNHDALTGLANRRLLERVLARVDEGVVFIIDLDHFDKVIDTCGHDAGDAVLAGFGHMLGREVRASDTTCRFGGDEFVVVTAGTDLSVACDLVERLRSVWSDEAPQPVTFSAGVAPVSAFGGTAALLAADRALFRAKELGCNRTELEPARTSLSLS
jgi:diguanylate cyclase (GGDEF)-like protein/PAS domain S-box-containing protein